MYNTEPNCDLERTAEEGTCSGCNPEAERRSIKRKNIIVIFALCAINLATCGLLLFVYTSNNSLLVVGFLNLAFTLLAIIAISAGIPQLVVVCVMYKILSGTYLSFLICKLIDTLVAKRTYDVTSEEIWVIVVFVSMFIEIRLLMTVKVQTEERTSPPPKYSSCALVQSPTNSQLPTYDEALKMIEQQKDETKEQSSSGIQQPPSSPPLPPIYTVQNTGSTRSLFRNNICI